MCGCVCLSYHLLCKPILSLQPRLAPRNPELAARFSGPPGCLALRLPWAEGSGSPLASHLARTVTQRDVSQIAGDSTSHSRRLRSSDLGVAADSAGSPQGSPLGIAPGRLTLSAMSPTLLTGSPLRAGAQMRIPPPASFFPSSTHSLNIWLGGWARPLTWRSLWSSLGATPS